MSAPQSTLSDCISPLNCVFIQKELQDADQAFNQLKEIAENIPRTTVLENNKNYWKGVCRSLIFRFPDDLEILKMEGRSLVNRSKGIIQIRSAARLGQSDLGVNLRRVEYLFNKLENL